MGRKSLYQRFRDKWDYNQNGCWIWHGGKTKYGYGVIKLANSRKQEMAHRVSYEMYRGAIPEGLQIDHLCKVPACVNPYHLEPVTSAENTRRGDGLSAIAVRTNRCKRGHEFTNENTYRLPSKPGSRVCKQCRNWHARELRKRRR